MAYGTNIIQAPVTMPQDIAAILGIDGTDLETLCKSGEINMWAVYKPVQYNKYSELTLAERKSVNFGIINIPTWTNVNKMAYFWFDIDTTTTNQPEIGIKPIYWGYQRPTGYVRLTDFSEYPVSQSLLGYFHEAQAPFGGVTQSTFTIQAGGTLRINFKTGAQDSRTVKLRDLTFPSAGFTLDNMYFGAVMRKVGTTDFYVVTQSTTVAQLDEQGAYVDMAGLDSSYEGEWEVFPMLSSDQIAFTHDTGQMTDGKFIALAEKDTIGIGVTMAKMSILDQSLSAYRDLSKSSRLLYVNITLVNDDFEGTLGASVLFEVFSEANVLLASSTITPSASGGSGQIPAGGSKLVSGSVDMQSIANLGNAYSVRATVTPDYGQNVSKTYAMCNVTDGPSKYA